MHKLAIVTVTMNFDNCIELIKSLKNQIDEDFHLYIADFSGADKAPEFSLKNMTVLKRENRGYAYGINEGLREAGNDGIGIFCALNDDIFFKKDFVKNVKKCVAARPGTLIGGKIYYAPGYEYHTDRYTEKDRGKVIWYAGGHIDWAHSQAVHRGVDEVDAGQYDGSGPTDFITGCLMVLDKDVIQKAGYLDESYFLYYEDTDYCERAKRAGIPLFYEPSLNIWHMVSRSTGGSGSSLQVRFQRKNLVKFALKYAPLRTKLHILKNYFLTEFKGK